MIGHARSPEPSEAENGQPADCAVTGKCGRLPWWALVELWAALDDRVVVVKAAVTLDFCP